MTIFARDILVNLKSTLVIYIDDREMNDPGR